MSGKLSEYVMKGCSVGLRVVAVGAGIAALVSGDSVAAPYIAVASAVCAVALRVINGRLVKEWRRLASLEDQLLGTGTGFFICSALAVNPIASIGGTVCVGVSLVLTVLRGVLNYCKKDEREVSIELRQVLSDPLLGKQEKKALMDLLFKMEEDIVRSENLLLDILFSTMNVKQQLKDVGFIALVDELKSLMVDLRSDVRDPEDRKELNNVEQLLKLGLGGEVLRQLSVILVDAETLKKEYKDCQILIEQIYASDNRRVISQLIIELKGKAESLLGGCFRFREEARGFFDLIKIPVVLAEFVNDVKRARDLIAKLIADSDVGGRAPNPKLHNQLQQLDRQLVAYVGMLQDLNNNQELENISKEMLDAARAMQIYAKSSKRVADSIRI